MNRITVRHLLDIQCEQKRPHVIGVEGHIGVCEKKKKKKKKQNLVILVVFLLAFLIIPSRFLVRGKKT